MMNRAILVATTTMAAISSSLGKVRVFRGATLFLANTTVACSLLGFFQYCLNRETASAKAVFQLCPEQAYKTKQ